MYLLLKRIKISVDGWLRVSCQEICRCIFASSESIPRLSAVDNKHDLSTYFINGNRSAAIAGWIWTVSSLPRWVGPRGQFSALWIWRSPETRVLRRPGWTERCSGSWGTPRLSSGLFFSFNRRKAEKGYCLISSTCPKPSASAPSADVTTVA